MAIAQLAKAMDSPVRSVEYCINDLELKEKISELQMEMDTLAEVSYTRESLPKAGVSPYAKFDKLHRKHRKK